MALDVLPGDTVRVSFTLTNTGSPVSGVTPDEFFMSVSFLNDDMTGNFLENIQSGAMITGQAKNFSADILVPLNIIADDYNLDIYVQDPNNVTAAQITISDSVTVGGVYSASISNISVTKV